MDIKATPRRGYILKFLLIGLAALAFGGVHLKDAIFVYPQLRTYADAYEQMRGPLDENGNAMISDGDLQEQWKVYALENKVSIAEPVLNEKLDFNIAYNYLIGVVFSAMGVACLLVAIPTFGKWIELRDGVLRDNRGTEIDLQNVTSIDKKRWEKKGIAKVISAAAGGKGKTITIDDIKFEREPADQIMAAIEQTAGEDKIVNGLPESHYAKIREEKLEELKQREAALNEMDES